MDAMRIAAPHSGWRWPLVYGKFSCTKETHASEDRHPELSVKDKETVNVPVRQDRRDSCGVACWY
jgi:hypothetical protein